MCTDEHPLVAALKGRGASEEDLLSAAKNPDLITVILSSLYTAFNNRRRNHRTLTENEIKIAVEELRLMIGRPRITQAELAIHFKYGNSQGVNVAFRRHPNLRAAFQSALNT